ncbi:MAG: hypothetical protein M3438_03430 [Pseudomonadota bacterium]|nr:hypothetical protein [Pseudomonadota bacterium]
MLPRRRRLAGAQADDRVLDPNRLTRLHPQVADDSIALVEQPQHRHPLGHRRYSGGGTGLAALRLLGLGTSLLLLGRLVAIAPGKRQRRRHDQGRAHAYSGVQGK